MNKQQLISSLQELTNPSKLILFQNFKFDWKWIYHHLDIDIKHIYDTFIAECILTTGYERTERALGLDKICFKYTGAKLDKSMRSTINYMGFTDTVIKYCADDVKYLTLIRERQLVELAKWYEDDVLIDMEMKFVRTLAKMEYNGIILDKAKWTEVYIETSATRARLEIELDKAVKDDPKLSRFVNTTPQLELDFFEFEKKEARLSTINWSSNKQKMEILKTLGIKTKSVDSKDLIKLQKKHKLIPILIEYSKATKLSTSFGKEFLRFINPVTHKIHTNFFQIISSGRVSSNSPNCLNIPVHTKLGEKIRGSFIAREGFSICDTDYSGMELRIVAEYADEPLWTEAFLNNQDLHAILCSKVFEIPIEDVNKPFPVKPEYTYRYVSKTISFMLLYGGTEHKLSSILNCTTAKAKAIIDKYYSVIPNVAHVLNVWAYTATTNGFIRLGSPYRRVRWFPKFKLFENPDLPFITMEKYKGEIARASRNQVPQGTNGCIIKEALNNLQDIIDKNNYPANMVLTVYDEIATEVHDTFIQEWKPIQEEEMIKAAQKVLKKIPVKVETTIAKYWKK